MALWIHTLSGYICTAVHVWADMMNACGKFEAAMTQLAKISMPAVTLSNAVECNHFKILYGVQDHIYLLRTNEHQLQLRQQ